MKLTALLLALTVTTASAGPVTLLSDQNQRLFRNTGQIILSDPDSGETLGTYKFATGGYGNGSAPFGQYTIGAYQGLDEDPLNIGERWLVHTEGLDDGEADDPGIPNQTKARKRTEIEIHAAKATNGTMGCFAILGGQSVYAKFLDQMKSILTKGKVTFNYEPNPEGVSAADELQAYYPHIRRRFSNRVHAPKHKQEKHYPRKHSGKKASHKFHVKPSSHRHHRR